MENMLESSPEVEDGMPCHSPAEPDGLTFAALLVQHALGLVSPSLQSPGTTRRTENDQGQSATTCILHNSLPREAVVNILRLPAMGNRGGEQVLRFTYLLDELRSVPIVLTDYPLPPSMTQTPGGMAVVGLTGTRLEVRASDEAEQRWIRAFLEDKLHPYDLTKESHDDDGSS